MSICESELEKKLDLELEHIQLENELLKKRSACWRSPRNTAVVQATQMSRCNQTHSLSTAPAPLMVAKATHQIPRESDVRQSHAA